MIKIHKTMQVKYQKGQFMQFLMHQKIKKKNYNEFIFDLISFEFFPLNNPKIEKVNFTDDLGQ